MLFVFMAMPQCLNNLHKYFPNDILCYVIFLSFALFNELSHITTLAIFHNDIESALFFVDNSNEKDI
jgi:hypothetical protein